MLAGIDAASESPDCIFLIASTTRFPMLITHIPTNQETASLPRVHNTIQIFSGWRFGEDGEVRR